MENKRLPQLDPSLTPQAALGCIWLTKSDRLRLVNLPQNVVDAFTELIPQVWSKGIQSTRVVVGAYEFQLKGYPWSSRKEESIPARKLMIALLGKMWELGWILHVATGVSRRASDKDTLFFRLASPSPPRSTWSSITFNQSDKLRIIDGSPALVEAIGQVFLPFSQAHGPSEYDQTAYEWKLKGQPWWRIGDDGIATRQLLLNLLAVVEQQGWKVYATIEQNTSREDIREMESWYLQKQVE